MRYRNRLLLLASLLIPAMPVWSIPVDTGYREPPSDLVDLVSAQAKRWVDKPVHAAWGSGWGPFARSYMQWASESQSIVFRSLVEGREAVGERPRMPSGPVITDGYRARESVLHMMYETVSWLDGYMAVRDSG